MREFAPTSRKRGPAGNNQPDVNLTAVQTMSLVTIQNNW
jgi:hypothetical protein